MDFLIKTYFLRYLVITINQIEKCSSILDMFDGPPSTQIKRKKKIKFWTPAKLLLNKPKENVEL
jgi:hypothetical protein